MKNTILILTILVSFSCLAGDPENKQAEGLFDKNQDGVIDIFYEYFEDGTYIELVDSNYDGEVDTRCRYDANDTLTRCSYDQDFNKRFETVVEYEFGAAYREGVDVNNNQLYEIVFYYKSGVLFEGLKYYENQKGQRKIGNVKFNLGYPSEEEFTQTEFSEKEFSKTYWLKE